MDKEILNVYLLDKETLENVQSLFGVNECTKYLTKDEKNFIDNILGTYENDTETGDFILKHTLSDENLDIKYKIKPYIDNKINLTNNSSQRYLIYDNSGFQGNPVELTDELIKDIKEIKQMSHLKNQDNILVSSLFPASIKCDSEDSDIVNFYSKGKIVSYIDKTGEYKGKISYENILNLPQFLNDIGNYYKKEEVLRLLEKKVNTDIFDKDDKILEKYIPDTLAKEEDIKKHIEDDNVHLTEKIKKEIDEKYVKPKDGIPFEDLNKIIQDKLDSIVSKTELFDSNNLIKTSLLNFKDKDFKFVTKEELKIHLENEKIHVTPGEKERLKKCYLKPFDGIAFSDLSFEIKNKLDDIIGKSVLLNTDNKVKDEFLDKDILVNKGFALTEDVNKVMKNINDYIAEIVKRTVMKNNLFNSSTGKINSELIDIKDLVKENLNLLVSRELFDKHTTDSSVHVTDLEKKKWNDKYSMPFTGIPISDLCDDIKDTLDNSLTKKSLFNDKGVIKSEYIDFVAASIDKNGLVSLEDFNTHKNNKEIHVTPELLAKIKNDMGYKPPKDGIPLTDLSQDAQNTINAKINNDDLIDSKTSKIKTDLLPENKDLVTNEALTKLLLEKINKTDLIQEDGKLNQELLKKSIDFDSFKVNLTEEQIEAIQSIKPFKEEVNNKLKGLDGKKLIDSEEFKTEKDKLDNHIVNKEVHVSTEEKERIKNSLERDEILDKKGHIKSDLLSQSTGYVTNDTFNSHINNKEVHVSIEEKNKWNKTYTLPSDGIPNKDINSDLIKEIQGKYNKPSDGIPKTDLNEKDLLFIMNHSNLSNKGVYSHVDIDRHMESDILHSNVSLGKWVFEGSQQMDLAVKDNTVINKEKSGIELSKQIEVYLTTGNFITQEFDTGMEDCKYTALFYMAEGDSITHNIEFYTRTGSTSKVDEHWESWKKLENNGKLNSKSGRYIQVKCVLGTSDNRTSPTIKKFTLFYGRNTTDELKEAIGKYPSLANRLDIIEKQSVHTNIDVLNKLDSKFFQKLETLVNNTQVPFVKEIKEQTTIEIPKSEHNVEYSKAYLYNIKFFISEVEGFYEEYVPKQVLVNDEGLVKVFFSKPTTGTLIIK